MSSKKKVCSKCQKEKILTDYYKSYSPIDADERLRICKICVQDMVNKENVDSWKNTLRMLDKPFMYHLYQSAMSKSSPVGEYFKLINAKDYRHSTWKDSVFEKQPDSNNEEVNEIATPITNKQAFIVTDDIVDKWGFGYSPDEYRQFERKYSKLINNYGEKTALHTEGLLSYIRFRVKEELATARGEVKEAKEWGAMASKAAQDAKINVSQLSKSDISGGVDVLGQLFEAVETEVSVIPLLPQLTEQPYDDADLIIWATVNYNRRLEDKSSVSYKEIWDFYDEMLEEHFNSQGFTKEEVEDFKAKRNNVFRDLEKVYIEPIYESEGE